jgi:hypothetical protein
VWNISSATYADLTGPFYFYMGIYIQQSDLDVLPSTNSPWNKTSGNFVIAERAPTSSSSTINVLLSSTTVGSTTSSTTTYTAGGATATSSAGAIARTAGDQLGWGILGAIGVLVMW